MNEQRTPTGSEIFSLLLCFDATKYVFQGVFTLIETICSKTWANRGSRMQNVYFRLMYVAEKRHCLRDGPLENLRGGRSTKKIFAHGKIK